MSVRPSTSSHLRQLDDTFEEDCSKLKNCIEDLKSKVIYTGSANVEKPVKSHNPRLANRAKDLRNMTEQVKYKITLFLVVNFWSRSA